MAPFGGFSHNDQTLRILTRLERRYAEFDGLNLTWEALEGTVKHNGPLRGAGTSGRCRPSIAEYDRRHELELDSLSRRRRRRSPRSPTTSPTTTTISTTGCAPGCSRSPISPMCRWSARSFDEVAARYPGIEEPRLIHESIRRLIDRMVRDLIAETGGGWPTAGPDRPTKSRASAAPVVAFSDRDAGQRPGAEGFLFERMYRHYRVNRMSSKARRVVHDLFALYLAEPRMPAARMARADSRPGDPANARASSPTTSPE